MNTLQRRKEAAERYREVEAVSATMVYPGISIEDGQRSRVTAASLAAKVQYITYKAWCITIHCAVYYSSRYSLLVYGERYITIQGTVQYSTKYNCNSTKYTMSYSRVSYITRVQIIWYM